MKQATSTGGRKGVRRGSGYQAGIGLHLWQAGPQLGQATGQRHPKIEMVWRRVCRALLWLHSACATVQVMPFWILAVRTGQKGAPDGCQGLKGAEGGCRGLKGVKTAGRGPVWAEQGQNGHERNKTGSKGARGGKRGGGGGGALRQAKGTTPWNPTPYGIRRL